MNFLKITIFSLVLLFSLHGWCDSGTPDHTYQVSGEVRSLNLNSHPPEVLIKHEEIPTYRDVTGKVVGMHSMTMPFYLAEGVSTSEIKVGDTIEFTISQWISPNFKELVTEMHGITNINANAVLQK